MKLRWLAGLVGLAIGAGLVGCGGGGSTPSTSAPGSVSGAVFVDSRALAAGSSSITVAIEGSSARATASADGSFVLPSVPAGYQTVVARVGTRAVSVVALVEPGKETDLGQLALSETGSISGTVTAAAGGGAIAGARVTVLEAVTANDATVQPRPVRRTETDASGAYSVDGLEPGAYAVLVGKRGFVPVASLADVTAGAATTVNVSLATVPPAGSGVVEGTVSTTDAAGATVPLAGALVRLGRADETGDLPIPDVMNDNKGGTVDLRGEGHGGPRPLYAYTDEAGGYRIEGVPAGSFRAVAVRAGFERKAVTVQLADGQVLRQDFTLAPHAVQVGAIGGIVTDQATGKPIAGAAVAVRMQAPPPPGRDGNGVSSQGGGSGGCVAGGGLVMATVTDATGAFALKAPAGDRLLLVQANGYTLAVKPVTVVANETVTANVALSALTGETFKLSGTVVAAADGGAKRPVAGAMVVVVSAGDPAGRPMAGFRTQTDASGAFAFRVPAGPYVISAHKERMMAPPAPIDVTQDTTVELDLSVTSNR